MEWGVVYYRHADGQVPAEAFLDSFPTKVEATILAVLEAVRVAPPPAFSGGGKWEAMHGTMAGYYEIRVIGSGRRHYRLFCLLDNENRAGAGRARVRPAADRRDQRDGQAAHERVLRDA
jgi:hypothetical protein